MRAPAFAFRAWSISVALGLCVACAADAGDPSKLDAGSGDEVDVAMDAGGGGEDVRSGGEDVRIVPREDSGGGSDVGSVVEASASEASAPETGADTGNGDAGSGDAGSGDAGNADTGNADSGSGRDATGSEASEEGGVPDAGERGDASACLAKIPSTCPDCVTQNPSDKPICEKYLTCFADHDCNPGGTCASSDGVCGVNTIGGGEAPFMAATQTYDCACP